MSYENEAFRKAARDAGISGSDWGGNQALDDFSQYYHNQYDKWDRERHGYHGIFDIAKTWWRDNGRKYS